MHYSLAHAQRKRFAQLLLSLETTAHYSCCLLTPAFSFSFYHCFVKDVLLLYQWHLGMYYTDWCQFLLCEMNIDQCICTDETLMWFHQVYPAQFWLVDYSLNRIYSTRNSLFKWNYTTVFKLPNSNWSHFTCTQTKLVLATCL